MPSSISRHQYLLPLHPRRSSFAVAFSFIPPTISCFDALLKSGRMDPFSITVGVLGITKFAISSINELRGVINGPTEAKEVVQDITLNLGAIQRPLAALENIKISESVIYATAKEDLTKTGVVEGVNNCGNACANFTSKLKKWTKHSSSTKLSLRDRLIIGVWKKEEIYTLRRQVQSCQTIVHFAVGSAQLLVIFRTS